MQEKPTRFPTSQINGQPMKPLTQVLLDRRATAHFKSDEIPDSLLENLLLFAGQSPSGYNLQPWRFLVVRREQDRKRLMSAAFDQKKVGEAPVVIVAFALRNEWKQMADEILLEGARRGLGNPERAGDYAKDALDFISGLNEETWLNRHVMIAFTTLMLVAESYGLDTAPMEGFDADAVRREFGIPEEGVVVALLAMGFAKSPDRAYPGRLELNRFVHVDRFGKPWTGKSNGGQRLQGKRVAILAENGFEQWELTKPRHALQDEGAVAELVSPSHKTIRGWKNTEWGDEFPVDRQLEQARAEDYDALLLPGGVMNPDKLRRNKKAVQFVRQFFESQKPVAAICHGPQILIEAGVVFGKRMTSFESIQTDLKNAGADWVDEEVVVDHGLVTSRKPEDIPAFNRKMIELFIRGVHAPSPEERREVIAMAK